MFEAVAEVGSSAARDGALPPKVSVCLITHDHSRFIAGCLENILAQETDFEFEVIVADDLSSDATREIVREIAGRYPGLFRMLFPESKIGAIETYTQLHDAARGEYVAHIDGDDLMYQGRLALQARFLDQHPECVFVAHDVQVLARDTDEVLSETYLKGQVPEIVDLEYLIAHGCFFVHSSKMYRRTANVGLPRDRNVVDFYIHVHHVGQGRFGFIGQVLGAYRKGLGTMSSVGSPYFEYIIQAHLAAFELGCQLGVSSALVDRRRAEFKYVHAMLCLRQGDEATFRSLIALSPSESDSATLRHRVVARLARHSWLVRLLVRCYDRLAAARAR